MIASPVTLVEMALNFSVSTCFGLAGTEWGKARHGNLMGASIGLSLLELFTQIFLGGAEAPQPAMVGVTSHELKRDLDGQIARLEKDFFQDKQIDRLAQVQTLESYFKAAWDNSCDQLQSATGNPAIDDALNKDWSAYYATFEQEYLKPTLVETCNWVSDHEEAKYKTLDFYALTAGLFLNICQLCLLIEYNNMQDSLGTSTDTFHTALLHWKKVEYPAWQAAHAHWESKSAFRAQQALNQRFGPGRGAPGFVDDDFDQDEPVCSPRPIQVVSFDQLISSPAADAIRRNVATFVAYLDPLVSELEQALVAQRQRLSLRTSQFTVENAAPNAYLLRDRFTGITGASTHQDLAEDQKLLEIGIVRAGLLADADPKLAFVTDDSVKMLRQTVDNWKASKKNYDKPPAQGGG